MATFENVLRKLGSYAGIVEGLTNSIHLPASVRSVIVAVSGAILSIEHYSSKQTPKQ